MAEERGAAAGEGALRQPWRSLEGKVVMVTGASSGLGREICLDLAGAGCLIVAAARRVDRLVSLCEDISRLAPPQAATSAAAVELDLSADGSSIERSVQKAWDAFGRIDALVNNAGVRGIPLHLPRPVSDHPPSGDPAESERERERNLFFASRRPRGMMRDLPSIGKPI